MTREPNIKGLEDFFHEGDKYSHRFFAGRQELISAIERSVDSMRNDIERVSVAKVGSEQRTWLIQGSPGAGKTALQRHLRQRWQADKNGPIVVDWGSDKVLDEHLLATKLANAILPEGAELLMSYPSALNGMLTIYDLQKLYHNPRFPKLRRFLLPFARSKTAEPRPVVLMLDDIHAMNPKADILIHGLHIGTCGVPILPLLTGLSWSLRRLMDKGISRFAISTMNHVQTLEQLRPEEAAESVKLMLKEYYVTSNETEEIANWIAKLSDGWPQHLHYYMRALAGDLVTKGGNLSKVNRDGIQAEGDAKRKSYYLDRLKDTQVIRQTGLLAEVARFISDDGCDYSKLVYMLEGKRWQHGTNSADVMPKNMKPADFIQDLIRAGIVQINYTQVIIPIPSFRQFLIEYHDREDN